MAIVRLGEPVAAAPAVEAAGLAAQAVVGWFAAAGEAALTGGWPETEESPELGSGGGIAGGVAPTAA